MKRIYVIAIASVLLFQYACKKNDKNPTSGEATINSERVLEGSAYTIQGFQFNTGSVVMYNPQTSTNTPDLFVLPIVDPQGNVTGAYLDSPNILESFALVGTYGSAAEAREAFNNYTTVNVPGYTALANPIGEHQVWVFKTRDDHFAKILVLEIQTYKVGIEPNAEVRFRWVYQPDGSSTFPG
jgi:hypothetical protein